MQRDRTTVHWLLQRSQTLALYYCSFSPSLQRCHTALAAFYSTALLVYTVAAAATLLCSALQLLTDRAAIYYQ
jgi:hypothetical protein